MVNVHSELWLHIGELKTLSMHEYISCMISLSPVITIYTSVISSFNAVQFSFNNQVLPNQINNHSNNIYSSSTWLFMEQHVLLQHGALAKLAAAVRTESNTPPDGIRPKVRMRFGVFRVLLLLLRCW